MREQAGIKAAALVQGLPHILMRELNPAYAQLAAAMDRVGDRFEQQGIERVLYYSTQWLSVLGHSVQARCELQGHHVDENWHDLPDLPFHFRVDRAFADKLVKAIAAAGYPVRSVDYEGFPVDSGTIVADGLINHGRFQVGMLSCCVYSDYAETRSLAETVRMVLASDPIPTALVCVSGLSMRWITETLEWHQDRMATQADDAHNQRLIRLIEHGQVEELEEYLPVYQSAAKADMGMKALAVLAGLGVFASGRRARCKAYGAVYGTGAAVIEW